MLEWFQPLKNEHAAVDLCTALVECPQLHSIDQGDTTNTQSCAATFLSSSRTCPCIEVRGRAAVLILVKDSWPRVLLDSLYRLLGIAGADVTGDCAKFETGTPTRVLYSY